MNIPFIKYSKVWLGIAIATVVLAFTALFVWGLKPGIDFTGGSMINLKFTKELPSNEAVVEAFKSTGLEDTVVQRSGNDELIIRTNFLKEDKHQEILKKIREISGDNQMIESSLQTIGSSVSKQLRTRSIWAIILVNLGIMLYIGFAFRKVSQPVKSWKYGLLALTAMVHDVLLVIGVFAVLGHFKGVEIDVSFVVALLTVLGFSVHDTIVVYDRIRENLIHRGNRSFSEVVNAGLNQTLMRSINTTLTTILTLTALYFWGGMSIHNFTLALLIGFAVGAYSSIFIAAPLLVMVENKQRTGKF